ncbi:MAG: tRNA pseudouridine(55) synthase TruB [Bdellovibrionota bacterium]
MRLLTVSLSGALLVNKVPGVSSFGSIEQLQKLMITRDGVHRKELPKLGHGGTLDPFATGVLPILTGRAVKLARYFLGATKTYRGVIRFGETTIPGDPTDPISETSNHLPSSIEELRALARNLTQQPYLQTPPMHSAKKVGGRPLYELARQGKDIERAPKLCHLHRFEILSYEKPKATFELVCSSGTYVRTLAQDFARLLGSVAMLDKLERATTGVFHLSHAMTLAEIESALQSGQEWDELKCWVPFNQLLRGYARAEASPDEAQALIHGQQTILPQILSRMESNITEKITPISDHAHENQFVAIYCTQLLVAVAAKQRGAWELERVFTSPEAQQT